MTKWAYADGDPLTATLVSGPTNAASFSLNVDGSFTYTPVVDFNGIDTFTYKANDGGLDSNVATVTITVNPVIDLISRSTRDMQSSARDLATADSTALTERTISSVSPIPSENKLPIATAEVIRASSISPA